MNRRLEHTVRAAAAVLVTLAAVTATGAAAPVTAEAAGPSPVTVAGTGDVSSLKVTVSQTQGLIDQVVKVSWSGAAPTRGNFGVNYLQIMQCWGDTAPVREQCQYGGLAGDTSRGGAQVTSRQLTYDIKDPKEELKPTPDKSLRFAPFRSVDGTVEEKALSQFFDASTTNEVPFALTRTDGTGEVPFETQTSKEAPGLGCGGPVSGAAGSRGRNCWLVVVPRNDREVDGSTRTADTSNQLLSSPLSQTNWDKRLVVPLGFEPVGQPCPLGRAEQPVVGNESLTEAVSSWQPLLCEGTGPVFSYSQLGDNLSRRQITGDRPRLSATTLPVPQASVPSGRAVVYAPLVVSGLAITFNVESQAAFVAPDEVKARNGRPLTELKLNQRLVAKLLTQSYKQATAPGRKGLEDNSSDLTRDKEFQALNPAFASLNYSGISDITVPVGSADAFGALWSWVLGDPAAKAFLNGTPDLNGMKVNPAYRGLAQQDGFPKSDPTCQTFPGTTQPQLCTLDAHPYAADGHEAARGAARGDNLARSFYDATASPPVYKRQAPQRIGTRAILALSDTATATRFGLTTASLPNASGAYVAPTTAALSDAVGQLPASGVAGVLAPAGPAIKGAGYPLTTVTYASAVPAALTKAQGKDYADFLTDAAGKGQVQGIARGQLPLGYAPLSAAMRQQTNAAAARIASQSGPAKAAPAPAGTTPATAPAGGGVGGGTVPGMGVGPGPGTGTGSVVTGSPAVTPQLPGTAPQVPGAAPAPVVAAAPPAAAAPAVALTSAGRSPRMSTGAVRWALPLVLLLGAAALVGSPILLRRAGTS